MKIGTQVTPDMIYVGEINHRPVIASIHGEAYWWTGQEAEKINGRQTHLYNYGTRFQGRSGQLLPFTLNRWARMVRNSIRVF